MDCSLPGFSVHGIFQVRILERVTISFSKGSFQPRDWTGLPHCRQILYHLSHQGSPLKMLNCFQISLFYLEIQNILNFGHGGYICLCVYIYIYALANHLHPFHFGNMWLSFFIENIQTLWRTVIKKENFLNESNATGLVFARTKSLIKSIDAICMLHS